MTFTRIPSLTVRFGLAIALLAGLLVPGVYAQNTPARNQSLELSPTKAEITMDPGNTATARFGVRNLSDQTVGVEIEAWNMLPKGEAGGVSATKQTTPYELQTWATLSSPRLTVPAKQRREVTVTLNAPQDASPGGHYGMVRFAADAGQSGSVAVRGVVGALLLVNVSGDAKEQGSIEEAFLKSDGKELGGFFLGSKLTAAARFKNSGNVHFPVSPQFTAESQFGGKTLDKTLQGGSSILPGAERVYEVPWDNVSTGYYTVQVEDSLPGDPKASQSTKILVVTPRVAIAVGLIVLALIILVVRRHRRKRS